MSFQAMAWAVQHRLPVKEKITLLILANYASNKDGDCYPSIGTLADDTGMSKDSVIRAIKELEDAGLLSVNRRQVEGVNLPNSYRLNLAASSPEQQGVVADSGDGSRTQRGGVVAGCDSNLSLEPISDPEKTIALPAARTELTVLDLVQDHSLRLPLNTGDDRILTTQELGEMTQLYPAVDVKAELRKMRGWLLSNPTKRKTKSGVMRFVHTWLAKQQDRGGTIGHAQAAGMPSMPQSKTGQAIAAIEEMRRGLFQEEGHEA